MKYLIFRTDRIGDFLITLPLINSIKRNNPKAQIFVVSSNKNNEFIKNYNLIDKVFLLKSKNLKDRIKLFFELKKYSFETIIISDKKNRSHLLAILLKSSKKIFNVSKVFQKKLFSIFYKSVFLDNDNDTNNTVKKILQDNCNAINFKLIDDDFHSFKENQFIDQFPHKKLLKLDKSNLLIFHYDEKWEINKYLKSYKKASSLTAMNIKIDSLLNFISDLSKKTSMKVIITTGNIKTDMINELINISKRIDNHVYELSLSNSNCYLLDNESFLSISHLISKSSLFISCHGAFTHVASNYKIKILDIIEENKKNQYTRLTNHIINYKYIYRDKFNNLSKKIIEQS